MENPVQVILDVENPETLSQKERALFLGVDEFHAYTGMRPPHIFTMRFPFPLFLEFKREVQRIQRECEAQNPDLKERYTMTAFVTAAVQKIILPALKNYSPQAPQSKLDF